MTAPAVPGGVTSPRRDGAAARLYVEYRERIYRFCLSRLRSREEAEDAVQNVFLRVHTALDRGVVPEYEAAWLYKIAHNVCLSRIDSNSRRSGEELHSFDDDDVQFAAHEVSGDELAGLNEALEAMPHNLRTAILLREWQGLSYAEVAVAMGLSVSAVETLIFRARRHLAFALENGPDAKRYSVSRLLNVPGLGWLRNLFAGAAPAKLAAGAALVALGGGGAAVALTATMPDAGPSGRQAPPPRPAQIAPVVAAGSHRSTAEGTTASITVTTLGSVTINGVTHQVPVVVVTTSTSGGSPAAAPPQGAPRPVAGGQRAPTASVSVPRVTTPTTTGAVTVPTTTVQVPTTVPVPTVSVPTRSIPTVTVPTVSVPTVSVPTVSVPSVSVPTVSVPSVSVPTVSVPTVTVPTTVSLPLPVVVRS